MTIAYRLFGQNQEVFVKINGELHYVWRAVDHEGEVLETYVSKRRNHKAALKFLKKTMKRYGKPKAVVTDRLRLNNNSYLPFRRKERWEGNTPVF